MSFILSNILYPPDFWGYEGAGEIQRGGKGPGMGRKKRNEEEGRKGEERNHTIFFSICFLLGTGIMPLYA